MLGRVFVHWLGIDEDISLVGAVGEEKGRGKPSGCLRSKGLRAIPSYYLALLPPVVNAVS